MYKDVHFWQCNAVDGTHIFKRPLHFAIFAPILVVMLSRRILLPQYKNSPPKVQTTAFKNSFLKIGGVDARSLVEIKQRRIGYTLSIYFGVATTQIPAYFQKILDIPVAAWNTNSATQQLSNSATQQLSNSATQQLSNSATQQLSNSATQGVKTVCALTLGQLFFTNSGIFSYTLLQAAFYFLIIDTAGVTCSGIFCTAALQRQRSDNPIINKTLDRNVNSARLPAFSIGKMCTVFRQGW